MNITSEDFENKISDVIMAEFGKKIADYVVDGKIPKDIAYSLGVDLAVIVTDIEMNLFF